MRGWSAAGIALALAATPAWGLDIEGHRGARGLLPENTLPAFAAALSIGVTTLEFDTGVTRDGIVVVSHNRRASGRNRATGEKFLAVRTHHALGYNLMHFNTPP